MYKRNYCRYEIVSYIGCIGYIDHFDLDTPLIRTTKKYGIIGIIENKDGSIKKEICSDFSSIGIVVDFVLLRLRGNYFSKWSPLCLTKHNNLEVLYEFNTFKELFKKYPELKY